jgi:hypothetical protein
VSIVNEAPELDHIYTTGQTEVHSLQSTKLTFGDHVMIIFNYLIFMPIPMHNYQSN